MLFWFNIQISISFLGLDRLSAVISNPSQIDAHSSGDKYETPGACSETIKDKFQDKVSDDKQNDVDGKVHRSQQHSILEQLLRQEKNPRNPKQDYSDYKMLTPLVNGDELFAEDPDFDNESEWSIDIK